MYEISVRVRFSDIGTNNRLRLYEMPKYFQDSSIEHSESLGIGIPYLRPRNLAWLLTSWQIDIKRLPGYDERLTIRTWPYDFKGAFGYRNYEMLSAGGEVLVKAYAIWLHTDIQEMKPVRVPEEEAAAYGVEAKLDMEYLPRKIQLPTGMEEVDRVPVNRHLADMYQHMNNAMYVDIASDYIPEAGKVMRIRVDYRKQVKVGDILVVKRAWEGNHCFVAFYDEADDMHVSTEFILDDAEAYKGKDNI